MVGINCFPKITKFQKNGVTKVVVLRSIAFAIVFAIVLGLVGNWNASDHSVILVATTPGLTFVVQNPSKYNSSCTPLTKKSKPLLEVP